MGETIRLQGSGNNVMGSNTGDKREIKRLQGLNKHLSYKLHEAKRSNAAYKRELTDCQRALKCKN